MQTMLGRVAKHFPLKTLAKSFSRAHNPEPRGMNPEPFLDQRESRKIPLLLSCTGAPPHTRLVCEPRTTTPGAHSSSRTPTLALGITCCELLKIKPWDHTEHRREGLAFPGWEFQIEAPGWGLWSPLPRATGAAGCPAFHGC